LIQDLHNYLLPLSEYYDKFIINEHVLLFLFISTIMCSRDIVVNARISFSLHGGISSRSISIFHPHFCSLFDSLRRSLSSCSISIFFSKPRRLQFIVSTMCELHRGVFRRLVFFRRAGTFFLQKSRLY